MKRWQPCENPGAQPFGSLGAGQEAVCTRLVQTGNGQQIRSTPRIRRQIAEHIADLAGSHDGRGAGTLAAG